MKRIFPLVLLVAGSLVATAQTTAKPASHPATAGRATHKVVAHTACVAAPKVNLPAGLPVVAAPMQDAYTVALRYQDIIVGTGAEAEAGKIARVQYTGWLAADGRKFDSSFDHPGPPVVDKEGKYVRDADGKIQTGPPQPIAFPLGYGKVITGFDQGFAGMKVGGKRRIFIPWQLAYGVMGRPDPNPANAGIPAKADLIFDVELVGVEDLPAMPPGHGAIGAMHGETGNGAGSAHPMPHMHMTPGGTVQQPATAPAASAPAAPTQPK